MIELIQTLTSITQFSVPTMSEIITILFQICCGIIYLIGEATGMGYELANLVLFVVVHPLITLIFFYLWRKAQIKNRAFREYSEISHAQRS